MGYGGRALELLRDYYDGRFADVMPAAPATHVDRLSLADGRAPSRVSAQVDARIRRLALGLYRPRHRPPRSSQLAGTDGYLSYTPWRAAGPE